ncbi:MAG: hypothetical protein ACUVWX_06690 [Kiritimatiellia bacterium]
MKIGYRGCGMPWNGQALLLGAGVLGFAVARSVAADCAECDATLV